MAVRAVGRREAIRLGASLAAVGAISLIGGPLGGLGLAADPSATVTATAKLLGLSTHFVSPVRDYLRRLDHGQARNMGVPASDIEFVQELVEVSNSEWLNFRNGVPVRPLSNAAAARLHPFYRAYASYAPAVIDSIQQGKVGELGIANHCSGTDAPAACPPWNTFWYSWGTKEAVQSFLISFGWHQTAGYASGYSPDDYTKQLPPPSAWPSCGIYGAFRSQAIIMQSGSTWTYRYQEPEPNPEIWFGYQWPEWWWGNYVRWWHSSYC